MRPLRSAATAALLLAGLLAGCSSGDATSPLASRGNNPADAAAENLLPCPEQAGTAAAGAELLPPLNFDCLGGGTLDLGRAPGAPTVVNLWASWCGPCREELPLMQQLADTAGGQVAVVGVVSKDGTEQATAFAADAGASFPSAFDGEGELMTELGLNALPYTYLLDADGAIAYTQVGPVDSVDELRALVAEHLGVQL
jgi:cytochrome c biogenesis protein CcmG, thiol:disulfide interchange protein DsbE